jgi:hypothetical protein
MIKAHKKRDGRICQGDIFRDIEFLEYAVESNGTFEISKIVFPIVITLTQDCDLEQDSRSRSLGVTAKSQDKLLFSILVAPLYNAEHVYVGDHLSELQMKMQEINKGKTPGQNLRKNDTSRFHYLEFPSSIPIVPSVIDFKHYFSVNVAYLKKVKRKQFVCKVGDLFREDISQRFASFLSRIGLPELAP